MAVKEKFEFLPHTGTQPVRDASGRLLTTVEHDTGLVRVYYSLWEDDKQISGQQIGFLHPNGFFHFVIPAPPEEFVATVQAAIKDHLGAAPVKMAAPPGTEQEEEE